MPTENDYSVIIPNPYQSTLGVGFRKCSSEHLYVRLRHIFLAFLRAPLICNRNEAGFTGRSLPSYSLSQMTMVLPMKKIIALTLGLSSLLVLPDTAQSRSYSSVGFGYSPFNNLHVGADYGRHGSDALWWGLGGLSLGMLVMPFIVDPPYELDMPFSQPYRSSSGYGRNYRPGYGPNYGPGYSTQPVYSYPPEVPPGLCRWERTVLDGEGWPLLDDNGMPVKEYTIGSCYSPPN